MVVALLPGSPPPLLEHWFSKQTVSWQCLAWKKGQLLRCPPHHHHCPNGSYGNCAEPGLLFKALLPSGSRPSGASAVARSVTSETSKFCASAANNSCSAVVSD
jgi:hypothetical protein